MGTWEDAVDYINGRYQKSLDQVERTYVQKLRKASDAVVLQKLRMAEEQNHYLYDATYKEAQRRGLV